jgi:hypothetical protein
MNHQLFENWLLSEEPYLPEQAAQLREHLRTCTACSRLQTSWRGVELMFREAPRVAPATGFSARWQERLAEQRRLLQRRQALLILSFHALEILRTPGQLLMVWVSRLLLFLAYAEAARDFVASFNSAFFSVLSGPIWLFVVGGSSALAVLWIVLYKQLTSAQRIQI